MILMKAKAFPIVAACAVSYIIHLNLTHILSVLLSSMFSVTAPPNTANEPPIEHYPGGLSNEQLTQSGYMKSESPWPLAESDQDTESRVSFRSAHFSLSICGQVLLFVIIILRKLLQLISSH